MEGHPSVDVHTLEGGNHAWVGRVKQAPHIQQAAQF